MAKKIWQGDMELRFFISFLTLSTVHLNQHCLCGGKTHFLTKAQPIVSVLLACIQHPSLQGWSHFPLVQHLGQLLEPFNTLGHVHGQKTSEGS